MSLVFSVAGGQDCLPALQIPRRSTKFYRLMRFIPVPYAHVRPINILTLLYLRLTCSYTFRLTLNHPPRKRNFTCKKCTLVQALRLRTGRTAHRGSGGIALLFLDHGTRRGWRVSVTPRPLFTAGNTRYPLYRRLGAPQGRSGQVRKISPHRDSIPGPSSQ